MKRYSIGSILILLLIIFIPRCQENLTGPNNDLPDSFYNKVAPNLQPTLIDLFDEVKAGHKTNYDISNEYNSAFMPVDTLLRVLVSVRVSDKIIKDELEILNCELKNEGQVDLFYWIPLSNFTKVTELDEVLSINSKGVAIHW